MSDHDFDRRVRELFGEPASDPGATDRALARLRAEMLGSDTATLPTHTRAWRIVAAVAFVVIAVGLVTVLERPSATAAAFDRYSDIAASTPAPTSRHYPADRVETMRIAGHVEVGSGAEFRVAVRSTIDRRLLDDGSVRTVETVRDVSFPSELDRQTWVELGKPDIPETGDVTTATVPIDNGFNVDAISTEPATLLDALRSGKVADRPPGDDQTFLLIADLLTQPGLSSAQRAALYRAAGSLEGVRFLDSYADPLGRVGQAFSLTGDGEETILVVDPRTAAPLATEVLQDNHPIQWTAFDSPPG
jgi:hypothetical protein